MSKVRLLSVAVVWLVAAAAAYEIAVPPWRCNGIEPGVKRQTLLASNSAGGSRVANLARTNLALLGPCCRTTPPPISQSMLLGANYRFLGRPESAVDIYLHLLQFDRRPEIYLNLGEAQIEAGHDQEGLQNLIVATIYNPLVVDAVPAYETEMRNALSSYQIRLDEIKRARR